MNRIKELRERAGLSQKEVAAIVKVSRPTVSEWEHGKKKPSEERLKKLAEFYTVSTGVVLGYDEIPQTMQVLFVDDGSQSYAAMERIKNEPERSTLYTMAISAEIKDVRRAIAIMNALQEVE